MSAFGIGVPELLIIFVIALIVFGPGKLPEIGAQIGRAVREFRKTSSEITGEFTREIGLSDQGRPASRQVNQTSTPVDKGEEQSKST